MLQLRRILFPTDFSAVAEDAFSHAAYLASHYDAEVHVFNVVTPQHADQANPMDYLPLESAGESEGYFFATEEEIDVPTRGANDDNVPVVYQKMEGTSPAQAIVDYVNEYAIDLVVMGTHGRQGVDRLLSGSVSEEVVRRAVCPVFTVLGREEPRPGPEINQILAPVDFSEHTDLAVGHAKALADAYDASINLLHVVEDTVFPTVYGIDPITPSLPDVQDRAREALEQLAASIDIGRQVNVHVTTGYAAGDIVDFAEEHQADLIVMATHGRTGLQRFLIGSVAEKVVRQSPSPVFTVKSFGKSLLPAEASKRTGEQE